MTTYSLLREIADSWVLLAMTVFFLGCGVWAFRPGSRPLHDEAANLIFARDDAPEHPRPAGCDCGDAACECPETKQ